MSEQTGTEKTAAGTAWQIDRLQAKDAARLQRLAWQCYPPYYDYLWQPGAMEAYLTEAFDETLLAAELADDNLVYEIVRAGGEDLAFLKWHRRADGEGCPDAAYLERVYVSPAGAGRRIGTELIRRAVEGARAAGRQWIWLRAMADLPQVLARYEAAGFVTYAKSAITTPGIRPERAGMVVMRCALT